MKYLLISFLGKPLIRTPFSAVLIAIRISGGFFLANQVNLNTKRHETSFDTPYLVQHETSLEHFAYPLAVLVGGRGPCPITF